MKKLMDVCDIQYGYAFDSKKFSNDSSFIPLIRIRDVKRGYSETFYSGTYSKEYIVHRNDLLIGMDGEFNIARWSSNEALLNQRVCKIVAKNGTNEEYLRFAMSRKLKEIEEKTSFVTVKHLSAKELKKIILKMPNIEKQNKIANILVKLEDIIKVYKKELEKLNSLVQARFVEMFGDPIINNRGWRESTIGEDCFVTKLAGFEYSKYIKYDNVGDVVMVKAQNVKNGTLNRKDLSFISNEVSDALPRSQLLPGDVVMTYVGANIGDVALIDDKYKYHLAPNVAKIRVDDKVYNPVYFMYMLMFLNSYIVKNSADTAKAALGMERIRKLKVFIPTYDLQNQFATFVHQVNKSKFVIHKFLYCTTHNTKSIIKPRPNTKESGKIRGGKPHADEF